MADVGRTRLNRQPTGMTREIVPAFVRRPNEHPVRLELASVEVVTVREVSTRWNRRGRSRRKGRPFGDIGHRRLSRQNDWPAILPAHRHEKSLTTSIVEVVSVWP